MNNDSKKNIVGDKPYSFALETIKLYKKLTTAAKAYVFSTQLLRSGTAYGVNINEAISSVIKRNFVHKLCIALKESGETNYWLNLLKYTNYINTTIHQELSISSKEIMKTFQAIFYQQKKDISYKIIQQLQKP